MILSFNELVRSIMAGPRLMSVVRLGVPVVLPVRAVPDEFVHDTITFQLDLSLDSFHLSREILNEYRYCSRFVMAEFATGFALPCERALSTTVLFAPLAMPFSLLLSLELIKPEELVVALP